MEENDHQESDINALVPATRSEGLSLELIRTETVLSRLPVHNLAKQGRVNIQIIKTTATGEVELRWEVSYSDRYGQARQLAYKLDTIVINQRIDEAGRPLPKLLRIGSLNEICAELNLATHAGENTKDLKRAFLQNASAFITAKFNYKTNDNAERHVEAGVTRYGVIFTGEKLPDGRRADAVYITFNDPFWEVLNNAPVRPLDRAYMKQLPPAAQRFYEIISYKIFSAIKNDYPRAKITYSEYCTFSAQLRHTERQRVQDQMAKVLRPHKNSGYIAAVKYEPTIDQHNLPDWILYLTPGPRARAEFAVAHRGRKSLVAPEPSLADTENRQSKRRPFSAQQHRPKSELKSMPSKFDPQLVAEFTKRGVTEKKAIELLSNLKPGQDVIAQLEHTDQIVQNPATQVRNPAGFYIRLIETNTPVPDGFETRAKRLAREDRERKERERRQADDAREQLEWEYENHCATELDHYVAAHAEEFAILAAAKYKKGREQSMFMTESVARIEAREEMRKNLTLPTFEEFLEQKKQGTVFSLKPVAVSPAAAEPAVAEAHSTAMTEPILESSSSRALLLIPEPKAPGPIMIHLASDPLPPPIEIDGNAAANFA